MKVLLSIKPEFANKIFNGSKRFEFRRNVFKNTAVDTIVVYASSPISKVIGEFKIETVIKKELEDLWEETKEYSGISKEFYDSYFNGKQEGFAIKVKNTVLYKKSQKFKRRLWNGSTTIICLYRLIKLIVQTHTYLKNNCKKTKHVLNA